MDKKLSFIHAADLHIDSPFKGLMNLPSHIFEQVRNSTFHAFDRLIQTAINKQVDFILLVGDLFDHNQQSLRAQVHLRQAFKKLQQRNISVYLSYGNHDYINGNKHGINYPENVHIFPSEQVTSFLFEKNNEPLAEIYGFSYENRAVMDNKVSEYKINNEHIPFHIAMLHGMLFGQEGHDPYAPFRLNELKDHHFDYWALGHVHKRTVLSSHPPIIYSGNIQGRHRNEHGEKGCYYVQLSEEEVSFEFIPLQAIQFEAVTIDIATETDLLNIKSMIKKQIQIDLATSRLVYLTLLADSEQYDLERNHYIAEMIELINDEMSDQSMWTYVYDYKFIIKNVQLTEEEGTFVNELRDIFQDLTHVDQLIEELYGHKKARKFLKKPSVTEVNKRAYELLIHELRSGGNS